MLLNFLIEQQQKITDIQKENISQEEIKFQCEPYLSNKSNNLFSTLLGENNIIPFYIYDKDYLKLFSTKDKPQNNEKLFILFSSPLNESWKELMTLKGDFQFAIRGGFYQDEYDIYNSILMGFQGLTIYVTGLDSFQIQFLTEVAREYSFSLYFIVHNKAELDLVLETDAPYIVFSSFEKKNFELDTSLLYNMSQFVPKTASLFALSSIDILKNSQKLFKQGYSGLIYI